MKRFTISTVVSLTILDYANASKSSSVQQKLSELRESEYEQATSLNLAQTEASYVYPSFSQVF